MRFFGWFKERYRILRLWLADKLSLWALRIRGQKIYEFGWGCHGNEAAMLEDRIWIGMVLADVHTSDQSEDIQRDLARLAQIAKTTWCMNYPETHTEPKE